MRSDGSPGARTLMGALRGNKAALSQLVDWSLPRLSGKVRDAHEEIEQKRQDEWDAESARREAMNGNVTPEQTIGALSDLHRSLIRVLAFTPAALMADPENMEELNDLWVNAIRTLLVTIHNPSIKYGIIGGLEPDLREPAEEYFERYSRELWGTLFALTSEEEITASDFPPETGKVIEQVSQTQQKKQGGN